MSSPAPIFVPILLCIMVSACSQAVTPRTGNSAAQAPPSLSPTTSPAVVTSAERLKRAREAISVKSFSLARLQLSFIPTTAPEYSEAQKMMPSILKAIEAEDRETERARLLGLHEELRLEYERLMVSVNPHLNYIDSKLTKTKGGYALWATHEYFSQYTFTIGDDGPAVEKWINTNHSRLNDAGIVRVGVKGRGSYATWNYFDVR